MDLIKDMTNLNENTLSEQPTIKWFTQIGYEYKFGPDISPGGILVERKSYRDVILEDRLKTVIRRLNPNLSEKAIEQAVSGLKSIEHPNLEILNREVYKLLTEGIKIEVRDKEGNVKGEIVKVFDFENTLNNDFLAVNQFSVQGAERVRRADLAIFINGIPIAIFELKNPRIEEATLYSAYKQLQNYKRDIAEIFKYNQILVVSDLSEARYGTISSPWEWFKTWREEGRKEKKEGISELEILVKGVFQKARILDIIENFIVFEADSEKQVSKYTKKICLYHQYFGVNKAIERTLETISPKGNKKIGILWHTQGSGKTLSIVFYINKIRKIPSLNSPTVLFLTDRNDLDNQFYKTFLRTGFAPISKQAKSIKDLKEKLKNAGAELIFTTIQKFAGEDFETLSERDNIIVISDEAHRSQYAKLAANVHSNALPNASFMGITATPISLYNRDTRYVFGDYIDVYRMSQGIKDNAIVPIYYEARLVPLHLTDEWIEEKFDELVEETGFEAKELLKRKIGHLEPIVGADDRLKEIAWDIVEHFNNRGLEGKAMVVTISRKIAVKMYELISKIQGAPEVAVVISKQEEYKEKIQKEIRISEIEKRFKDPDDPLKIAIVCDMWLTGFDIPCLHTMYFDKPLKNHTLIQAIARVNRIFRDKPGGLVVDYIGVADDLRKALNIYDRKIIKETLIPFDEIVNKMLEKYDVVKSMLSGVDFSNWKYLEGEKLSQLFQKGINTVITDPKTGGIDERRKKRFLKESQILLRLFAFVMPHPQANNIKNDIEFFKAIRSALIKRTSIKGIKSQEEILQEKETLVKELISKSITAEGIIDIFALRGKEKADISILDEKFLEEVRKIKYKNVAIETLKKLLTDEIKTRIRKNPIRYRTLLELLEKAIEKYEDRIISATKVIEQLIEVAREIKTKEAEGIKTGLSEEELAFYDILAQKGKSALKDEKIKELARELIKIVRRDIMIDWTSNEIIKSRIRANIKLLLLKNGFSQEQVKQITYPIFNQVISLFRDYSAVSVA